MIKKMFKPEELADLPVNYSTFSEFNGDEEIVNNNKFWEAMMIPIEELQTTRFLKFASSKPISKIALLQNQTEKNE
jgi:hypothetical protein